MSIHVLITGVSGYLAGTLADHMTKNQEWQNLKRDTNLHIYGSVRTSEQAKLVEELYGMTPLNFDQSDPKECHRVVVENQIQIVVATTSATDLERSIGFMRGLAEVKSKTGKQVHYIHVSLLFQDALDLTGSRLIVDLSWGWARAQTGGAKLHSSHANRPYEWVKDDEKEYEKHLKQLEGEMPFIFARMGVKTDVGVLSTGDDLHIASYVVVPGIVYGEGRGFGNKISIQTRDVVRCAKLDGKVYDLNDTDDDTWVFSSVDDIADLYLIILRSLIRGVDIPHGKMGGFYFSCAGLVHWKDLYQIVATTLKDQGHIKDDTLFKPTFEDKIRLSKYLQEAAGRGDQWDLRTQEAFLDFSMAGRLKMQAVNSKAIGWKPKDDLAHLRSSLPAEITRIIKYLFDE
ncbi:hypothetical protein V866_006851 [Kwoniella sp. B9012]